MEMTLDHLVEVEDALEAISQEQSEDTFVDCHDYAYHPQARQTYQDAVETVRILGSFNRTVSWVEQAIQIQGAA